MRKSQICGWMAVVVAMAGLGVAAELKSGLQPGDEVGPFHIEKCGGASSDGKKDGDHFCYRCMLGNKPVVMVFTRKTDDQLASLVKKLDGEITKHADQKLSSFVNVIGPNADSLKESAKKFAASNKVENVALVVPEDNENGPKDFGIAPEAETTVILYKGGKVVANHALAAGKLDQKAIDSIVADVGKIVN